MKKYLKILLVLFIMVSSNMFARNSNTVSDSGIDFDEEVSYGSYALIDGKFVLVCDVEGSAIC